MVAPGQVQRGQIARKNNEITPLTSAFAAALRTSVSLSVSSGAPEAVSAPSPAVPSRAGLEPESGRAARNFLEIFFSKGKSVLWRRSTTTYIEP